MSRPVVFNWQALDNEAVALSQSVNNGNFFVINGKNSNFASGVGDPIASFGKVSRTVSITSNGDDYTGVNFTVFGTYNSQVVFEEIAGPDAGLTVETARFFDTVTIITVDADVENVSIGSGGQGRTDWYKADYNRMLSCFSLQIVVEGELSYSFQATLDDVETNTNPFVADITGALTEQADSKLVNSGIFPINYCSLRINDSQPDASLVFTIIEGGIK